MRRTDYLYIPLFTLFGVSVFYFFNFTAEDAYITYRYAENLVNTGALEFNQGESINALTSPLHALLSSALFYVTGHTVLANKIMGLFFLVVSAFLVWRRFKALPELQLLVLSLILLPSCVSLWAVGGLETPLLLFLATATAVTVDRNSASTFSLKLLCLITLMAGLGILVRYDSVLFFVPVVVGSLIRYWNYLYRLEGDELIVRDGLVTRNERHVPYARIQNIDLVQNPLHRMLGVAEVRVETAGGEKPEVVMRVLPDIAKLLQFHEHSPMLAR